jgi:hypothetical protein
VEPWAARLVPRELDSAVDVHRGMVDGGSPGDGGGRRLRAVGQMKKLASGSSRGSVVTGGDELMAVLCSLKVRLMPDSLNGSQPA